MQQRLKLNTLVFSQGIELAPKAMRNVRSPYVDNLLIAKAKMPDDISPSTIFRVSPVPELDLVADLSLPLRVYVLKCSNGKYYVGIAPAHKVKSRLREQFSGHADDSAHFCARNSPVSVLCVWPARHEAAQTSGNLAASSSHLPRRHPWS